jgi:hypothetical protein
VAEIRQCWIPQSRDLQAVKAGLRQLKNLSPGDMVVIPGTQTVLGTAPHFALITPPWDRLFAQHVTGVPDLEFWREVVVEDGRLSFYHRGFMRPVSRAEMTRVHVLAGAPNGPYRPLLYWAEAAGPDLYSLHCLKNGDCEAPSQPVWGRDLGPRRDHVYFVKPFEHGNVDHLHR